MPSGEVIIAAAGAGKTTRIVRQAISDGKRCLLTTFTNNNTDEINAKLYEETPAIPARVEVLPWFTFMLRECARPYQLAVRDRPIGGFLFVNHQSTQYAKVEDVDNYFFDDENRLFSDKLSHFACIADEKSGGAVIRRLKERFEHIYIDEVQDLAGWDLVFVEMMLKAALPLTMIGDHRQSTFATNPSNKRSQFKGPKIVGQFEAWKNAKLVTVEYEVESRRCNQAIADFADLLYPSEAKTKSISTDITPHDGVFLVSPKDVEAYRAIFSPQVLRYWRKIKACDGMDALNFGDCKGMTFDRVLVFPHGKGSKWVETGGKGLVEGKAAALLYVAITRARHSVAFVATKDSAIAGVSWWKPPAT